MKKLLPFVLLFFVGTQTKLSAQQSASLNSVAINHTTIPSLFSEPVVENTASTEVAEKVPGKMQAKKTAKKITSFFTKISKQITKGYEQLAVENSSTAVAISKTSIPGN